ncbi:hypothetical protein C8J43_11719 [Sphingomonas sp. PP-CE-1G-424]|nr:hypothetical protein C8J43_11719 [Sphingomonas sp. PP-CE-1G-424]
MEKTVFWSWQSDLDGRVTRELVRSALDQAIGMISANLDEAERPSLTSDTQGVAGTPDIVATILRKIDEAAVFVGDVTPIAISADGKACANPNVLIELGYAHRALGENRVLQIWNTAFDGATVDKLPFDMRGRRGPIPFHLPVGADREGLRRVRADLAKRLAEYLRLALDQLPAPPPEAVHWQPHFAGDPELWFDRNEPQVVTHPSHGSSKYRWKDHFPGYARLIPSKWEAEPGARASLVSAEGHPGLMARASSLNFGRSQGGAAIYWPSAGVEGVSPTVAVTQWFEKTGEFWGVAGGFLFERQGEKKLATGYFFKHLLDFLTRNGKLALEHGGKLPIHVRLGVNGLAGSTWPPGALDFGDRFIATEDTFEYQATLTSIEPNALRMLAVDAFNELAEVYGHEPFTAHEIAEMAKF